MINQRPIENDMYTMGMEQVSCTATAKVLSLIKSENTGTLENNP